MSVAVVEVLFTRIHLSGSTVPANTVNGAELPSSKIATTTPAPPTKMASAGMAFVEAAAEYVDPSKFTVSLFVITTDRLYVPLVWAMCYPFALLRDGRTRFRLTGVIGTAGTCAWVAASAVVASALARSLSP